MCTVKVWSYETGWVIDNQEEKGDEELKDYLLNSVVHEGEAHADADTLHIVESEVEKSKSLSQGQKNQIWKACAKEWAKLRKEERALREVK